MDGPAPIRPILAPFRPSLSQMLVKVIAPLPYHQSRCHHSYIVADAGAPAESRSRCAAASLSLCSGRWL
eukprot:5729604-Pleurochrysis_carterae.AAC.1